jgi:6-phosphofructokinase 2
LQHKNHDQEHMLKVITLTPNPALDISGHVAQILPNEKNYVVRQRRDPGGNGINAARISTRLGTPTIALGFLGGHEGKEIALRLKQEGVKCQFTPIRNSSRVNITVTNDSDHKQTRLTFAGPKLRATEIAKILLSLKKLRSPGIFLLGGSLPPGCPKNFHLKTAAIAQANKQGVIADLPARFLKQMLIRNQPKLLMLKPNKLELEELLGQKLGSERAILKAAHRLTAYSSMVCVSLGSNGAFLVTEKGHWRGIAPRIKSRGSVGAGDSMVGAMAARFARAQITTPDDLERLFLDDQQRLNAALEDAFRWGLAAGAATAEAEGTSLAEASRIKKLVAHVKIYHA